MFANILGLIKKLAKLFFVGTGGAVKTIKSLFAVDSNGKIKLIWNAINSFIGHIYSVYFYSYDDDSYYEVDDDYALITNTSQYGSNNYMRIKFYAPEGFTTPGTYPFEFDIYTSGMDPSLVHETSMGTRVRFKNNIYTVDTASGITHISTNISISRSVAGIISISDDIQVLAGRRATNASECIAKIENMTIAGIPVKFTETAPN